MIKMFYCLAIALVLLTVGLIRYRLAGIPLDRDEGEYAYGGQIVLEGNLPVQYVYSMKMPGIYYVYAVIMIFFGQTTEGIHIGLLCINLLTIIAVFLLAGRLMSPYGAITAAVSFALMSLSQYVDGVSANAEHFVIFFTTYGALVLWIALSRNSNIAFFLSGLLLAAGGMIKQHGIIFCIFALLYLAYEKNRRKQYKLSILLHHMFCLVSGMLIVPAILIIPIIYKGQFNTFWFWTVTCSNIYINQTPLNGVFPIFLSSFIPIFQTTGVFLIMAGLGIILLIRPGIDQPVRAFLAMYALLSIMAVCPGFYFRSHYFILLLPAAGLLAGLTICKTKQYLAGKFNLSVQWISVLILLALGMTQVIVREYQFFFQMTPVEACRSIFGHNPFPEAVEVADYIKNHTTSSDTIAILGSEPQILFYAQRHSATPYIYMYLMMQPGMLALQMQKNFINDIESHNPKYVVFVDIPTSWDYGKQSNNLIFQWFREYEDKNLKVVGTVQLKDDESIYRWGSDIQWPIKEVGWMALYERIQQ